MSFHAVRYKLFIDRCSAAARARPGIRLFVVRQHSWMARTVDNIAPSG